MPDLPELFRQVDEVQDDIVALEQALVRIPSVNTGFMPTGDETPVCELARDFLAEDGVESEILESAPNRGNLIARLEGRSGNARLMFMSHTDVGPGGGRLEVAVPSFQRDHCRRPRIWTWRVGLQRAAHRPVDGGPHPEAQRYRTGGRADTGCRRGRGTRRPVRVRLAGRQPSRETGGSLCGERGWRHSHRSGGCANLRAGCGEKRAGSRSR